MPAAETRHAHASEAHLAITLPRRSATPTADQLDEAEETILTS
jgi:hypothetical protein